MIPSRGGPAPSIHVFTPRVQLRRRAAHHHRTAHLKLAEVPVADGGAYPVHAAPQTPPVLRAPMVWRAWPRCRWPTAGPGRAPRRRTEPPIRDLASLVWRARVAGPDGARNTSRTHNRKASHRLSN